MYRFVKKVVPVIGFIILAYLLLNIGVENILIALIGADPFYLSFTVLLLVPHLFLQTTKWKYILSKQNIAVGFSALLRIYLVGVFYSIITPGKIGTLIRIAYLKEKTGKSTGECSSSVIVDRALDLFSMFALGILGAALLLRYLSGTFLAVFVSFFLIFVIAFVVFTRGMFSKKILGMFYSIAPSRYKERAKKASESFYRSVPNTKNMIIPFIFTIVSWSLAYSAMYFVALSVGIHIPFWTFITITPIATIAGLIPVTIGGWGTREAALIFLFSSFTTNTESIIAMSFLVFLMLSLLPGMIGATIALYRPLKNGKLSNNLN